MDKLSRKRPRKQQAGLITCKALALLCCRKEKKKSKKKKEATNLHKL